MFVPLPFFLSLLSWPLGVGANDDCPPTTWENPSGTPAADAPTVTVPRVIGENRGPIQPRDINCRFRGRTYDDANQHTCQELADAWGIKLAWFLKMNPTLLPDCSNIEPDALYCVRGFIVPLRSPNGFCGPNHNNAVCLDTDAQCCNSETWTCGNSDKRCEDGICYEGFCAGDRVYSTDGTCGREHGNRLCAGKWGDCCNLSGRCGTGAGFCGHGVCQSRNCSTQPVPAEADDGSDSTGTRTVARGLCSLLCSHDFCPAIKESSQADD